MMSGSSVPRGVSSHTDPAVAAPLPAQTCAPQSRVSALQDSIAMQEQIVTMLKERREARVRVLRQVREVLDAGCSADLAALNADADALRAAVQRDRMTPTACAPQEATTSAQPSSSPPTADSVATASVSDALATAQDELARLVRSVEASLSRAHLVGGDPDQSTLTGADAVPLLTMDELLGLPQDSLNESEDTVGGEPHKKRKRRNRKKKKTCAEFPEESVQTVAKPALTQRDRAERRALFDALDAVAGSLPQRQNTSSTDAAPPSTPAWLLTDDGAEVDEHPGMIDAALSSGVPEHGVSPRAADVADDDQHAKSPLEREDENESEVYYSDDFEEDESA